MARRPSATLLRYSPLIVRGRSYMKIRRAHCFAMLLGVGLGVVTAGLPRWAQAQTPPLMPLPSHMEMGDGQFAIDGHLSITLEGYSEPRLLLAKERFLNTLSRETGIPFPQETNHAANFSIKTGGASKTVQELGEDESYHLKVTPAGVELTAANPLGILHGLQTFLQL